MSDGNENELIPKGYRFYPTEEELLSFYLHNKLEKIRELDIERVIPVSNIYSVDPWQLPDMSGEPCRIEGSEQWFFFCPRQPREAHGGRPARTTPSGYWKATGSPGPVYSSMNRARAIGVKKTMVFYRGRAPCGIKTKWKMNEYRALVQVEYCINVHGSSPELRNEFSLCRVYKNSGCMRAFDRRPSIVASTSETNPNALPSDNRNHHGKKRARSPDISSSTDNDNNWNPAASLQEGAMDLNLIEDIDWDKLDWV